MFYDGRAEAQDRGDGHDVLWAVRQRHRDAVAGADAQRSQLSGELPNLPPECNLRTRRFAALRTPGPSFMLCRDMQTGDVWGKP